MSQTKETNYYYTVHGRCFIIYRSVYSEALGRVGQRLPGEPAYYNREEALRRVRELNKKHQS